MIKLEEWLRRKFVKFFYGEGYNRDHAYVRVRKDILEEIYKVTDEISKDIANGNQFVEAAFKLEVANAIDFDEETIEALKNLIVIAEKCRFHKFLKRNIGFNGLLEQKVHAEEKVVSRILYVAIEKCKERGLLIEDDKVRIERYMADRNKVQ